MDTLTDHTASSRRQRAVILTALVAIILLGAFLRFYQLGQSGVGNLYYASTVKSMLTSWHNFFYAAYEPGGSVSVDKPPVGFWFQALSAAIFGLNGFALALPQALAGVLALPLLFLMVKKIFGSLAGLIAALVLAVSPITIAAERNNTVDGLLVFVLLLSIWAAWRAVDSGRLRWLLLGAALVGLGFNIKMLQAYMVVPAFYTLYFFGAKHGWGRRIWHLALATIVLMVVSFSWAAAVDLTPADQRPYVGGSGDNSVFSLIFGHNGLARIFSVNESAAAATVTDQVSTNTPGRITSEVGAAGWLRLVNTQLAAQIGWLLPLAMMGLLLAACQVRWRPSLSGTGLAVLTWAAWLLPCALYFSFNSGIMHTYYLSMLGPALGAIIAITFWALSQLRQTHRWLGFGLAALISGLTAAYEVWVLSLYPAYALGGTIVLLTLLLTGLVLLAWSQQDRLAQVAMALVLAGFLAGPALWSGLTTLNANPNSSLPKAGPAESIQAGPMPASDGSSRQPSSQGSRPSSSALQTFLLQNTTPDQFLVAVNSSNEASPLILATGRAVLTLGGFSGGDSIMGLDAFKALVKSGRLRYVQVSNSMQQSQREIANWVTSTCSPAQLTAAVSTQTMSQRGPQSQGALYDCAP
ncbi:MAG TPA: glycosyltransferase family 39 protein [Anaerolineaceae bacterium]|nr:glycosyltransferase family 39 protein [Anaerolineaceae bacterium]HPN53451.1 glycosyltransferase family 39 protein [Anaerolineaceae bacterium]